VITLLLPLSLAHTLRNRRKRERKEIVGNKGKKKNNMKGPCEKAFLWIFFSSQLCANFKLQGLGHVWVQLPK